ncbi:hypothetical protein N9N67_09240 [Bacteriovoracaceae bacterium]|nr:hypothetical protein [Bacteriovoracaceae bacterium]
MKTTFLTTIISCLIGSSLLAQEDKFWPYNETGTFIADRSIYLIYESKGEGSNILVYTIQRGTKLKIDEKGSYYHDGKHIVRFRLQEERVPSFQKIKKMKMTSNLLVSVVDETLDRQAYMYAYQPIDEAIRNGDLRFKIESKKEISFSVEGFHQVRSIISKLFSVEN